MKSTSLITTLLLTLALTACQTATDAGEGSLPEWDEPSSAAGVLIGTVRHPDGRALPGVAVTAHGGIATRWPLQTTTTDGAGRYRFVFKEGTSNAFTEDGLPRLYVGVCTGSVRNVNPPEVLPWKDIWVQNTPGALERLDFTFDPEAVPEEFRD